MQVLVLALCTCSRRALIGPQFSSRATIPLATLLLLVETLNVTRKFANCYSTDKNKVRPTLITH
jgi:hypothetical protein